jgi:hypothetical protein
MITILTGLFMAPEDVPAEKKPIAMIDGTLKVKVGQT